MAMSDRCQQNHVYTGLHPFMLDVWHNIVLLLCFDGFAGAAVASNKFTSKRCLALAVHYTDAMWQHHLYRNSAYCSLHPGKSIYWHVLYQQRINLTWQRRLLHERRLGMQHLNHPHEHVSCWQTGCPFCNGGCLPRLSLRLKAAA
jgi:hypothetical protein